ncbi:MAG TPA: hypothetical protein VN740_03855, partial [Solirubrobacteraceae bacterium]|nr:hypothetical protein [Solirubrobacteraceae bacterium]
GGGGAWSGGLSAPSVWGGGGGGGAGASLLPQGASTTADSGQPMLAIGYVMSATPSTQPPPATTAAQASASAGAASVGGGGAVSVTLSCDGSAAGSCQLTAALSVTETIVSGHVTAVAARAARRPKAAHRTVTIGQTSVTLSGGQQRAVTVSLNVRGRQLLATHRKLKARLVVTQSVGAGPPSTIKSATVSLSLASKRRR